MTLAQLTEDIFDAFFESAGGEAAELPDEAREKIQALATALATAIAAHVEDEIDEAL
tara:strand:+ start:269 stop:439 length:171 start_codon:yes stop_codon:yes gene_type:complete